MVGIKHYKLMDRCQVAIILQPPLSTVWTTERNSHKGLFRLAEG